VKPLPCNGSSYPCNGSSYPCYGSSYPCNGSLYPHSSRPILQAFLHSSVPVDLFSELLPFKKDTNRSDLRTLAAADSLAAATPAATRAAAADSSADESLI
jgi:hypothetical protein